MSKKNVALLAPEKNNLLIYFLGIAILGVSTLTAFSPILANVPINVVLPLVIMLTCKLVFFEKLKLSTLIILRAFIILAVFNLFPRQLYVNVVLVFLVINILEATMTDFKRKKVWNGITGVVLAASVWYLKGQWIDLTSFGPMLHTYKAFAPTAIGTIAWIIAYTIWNWIFVTNEFSDSIAKLHVAILASPIISSIILWDPGFWLICRANSLTFGGCIQIGFKERLESKLSCPRFSKFVNKTKEKGYQIAFMVVNIALIAFSIIIK